MGWIRPQHLDQLCHRSLPFWVHLWVPATALSGTGERSILPLCPRLHPTVSQDLDPSQGGSTPRRWPLHHRLQSPPLQGPGLPTGSEGLALHPWSSPSGWNQRNWLLASSARSRSRRSSTRWQWGLNSRGPCGFIPRFTCPRLNRSKRAPWFLPRRLHRLLASSMEVPPTLSVASCSLAGVGGDSSTWWTGRVTALKKGPGSLEGTSWTAPSSGTSINATPPRHPEPGHLPDHILHQSPRTTATTPRTGRVPPTRRRTTTLSPRPWRWRWTLVSRTSISPPPGPPPPTRFGPFVLGTSRAVPWGGGSVTVCSSPVSAPLCQLATPPHQTKLPTPVSASFYRLPRLLIRPSLHTCDSLAAFKPAPVSASVPDCLVLCLIFQWFPPDWSPVVDLVCPWPACLVPVLDTTAAFCLWPRVWSPVADLVCPWPACLVSVLDTTAALCLWPRVRLFPPGYSPARLRGYTAHPVFLCCTWVLTIPVTIVERWWILQKNIDVVRCW